MLTQSFDLNVIPDSPPVVIHCDQYDHGTGRFEISLYENSIAYTPSSATVRIQGTKPDGHGFDNAATISGNVVTADLTDQMSVVAGDVRCQIVVTESYGRIGTFVFILRVQKSALPDDTEMSASDYPIIQEALTSVEDAEAWAVGERNGTPVSSDDPTYHNNSKYWSEQSASQTFGGLSDVDINDSTLTNGQVPIYNSTTEKWENGTVSTGSSSLATLTDVELTSATANQALAYNGTKWINTNLSGLKYDASNTLADMIGNVETLLADL